MIVKIAFKVIALVLILSCNTINDKNLENSSRSKKEDSKITNNEINQVLLETMLIEAKRDNKKVMLIFGMRGCGWCKRMNDYLNDTLVKRVLNKYFIVKKIDVNGSQENKELYKTYWKMGLPTWTILDTNRRVIINNDYLNDGKGINGYPDKKNEVEYFKKSLKKASLITDSECKSVCDRLKEH